MPAFAHQRAFLAIQFMLKMTGTKQRFKYGRKRKGNSFTGVQNQAKTARKTPPEESESTQSTASSSSNQPSSIAKCDQPISTSRKKMRPQNPSDCSSNCSDDGEPGQHEGYKTSRNWHQLCQKPTYVMKVLKITLKQNSLCSLKVVQYRSHIS